MPQYMGTLSIQQQTLRITFQKPNQFFLSRMVYQFSIIKKHVQQKKPGTFNR